MLEPAIAQRSEIVDELDALLQRAAQAMGRDIEERLREQGLTQAQRRALAILSRQALTPTAISLALNLDPGATTRLLDRLLAKRLCRGRHDGVDGRPLQLQITALGRSALERTEGTMAAVLRDWFSAVDDKELDVARSLLSGLLASRT
ncbi:MarR family winged helix-turn-helix transcriptional regulator [Roseateles violae]|uniref:MarR family transcriptional regulator n=1 Tax=Roseateles violae TaxID=3058042 RepID=A0ABT8DZA7_9BURK|nr:MarR family transcriptional regulator [Pelomonas sp. PFR6]MDN3922927.1 MarR family transcriptional regulator [Pelomonas sp. PFR6]